MKETDKKAVGLAVDGNVEVIHATFDDNGAVVTASGTITYHVTLSPDGVECSCVHGQTRHTSHSHDQALRLQAQHQKENL